MTDAAPAPNANGEEPSIEEILASIRKIISDEPGADASADVEDRPPQIDTTAFQTVGPESELKGPVGDDDEILDLSAFAEDKPMTLETSNAHTETFSAPAHPKVEHDQGADFDLGLEDSATDPVDMNVDINDIMASSTFSPPPAQTPFVSDNAPVTADTLLSDTSAFAATAAMAKLAHASEPQPQQTQLWVGSRTIEQVVEDLMRPMLKTWLDQNLPRLVERLVEKELARMARKATE